MSRMTWTVTRSSILKRKFLHGAQNELPFEMYGTPLRSKEETDVLGMTLGVNGAVFITPLFARLQKMHNVLSWRQDISFRWSTIPVPRRSLVKTFISLVMHYVSYL